MLGVLKVVAGATWPPACDLRGDGLTVAYENLEATYDVAVYDRHGNAAACGGEHFERGWASERGHTHAQT